MKSTRHALSGILRRLRRITLFTVLVLALPGLAGVSTERIARLDGLLDAYVEEGKLPGAVLQVTHDGSTVYHRAAGFRDREAEAPMQPDTIFRIASMSKAVVSAAVMMLQERGALLITQPIGDFLPEYAATTVAVAKDDGGYEVVDAASGQPLDAFLETEIFEPLGMKDTSFYVPPDKSDRLAVVYSRTRDGALERPGRSPFYGQGHYVDGPRQSFSGGAGLLSTTADYTRFLESIRRGGPIPSRKSVELMTTDDSVGIAAIAPNPTDS